MGNPVMVLDLFSRFSLLPVFEIEEQKNSAFLAIEDESFEKLLRAIRSQVKDSCGLGTLRFLCPGLIGNIRIIYNF